MPSASTTVRNRPSSFIWRRNGRQPGAKPDEEDQPSSWRGRSSSSAPTRSTSTRQRRERPRRRPSGAVLWVSITTGPH